MTLQILEPGKPELTVFVWLPVSNAGLNHFGEFIYDRVQLPSEQIVLLLKCDYGSGKLVRYSF